MSGLHQLALLAPALPTADINVGGELVRVVLSLLGIIVLILGAGWLSRRLQARTSPGGRRIRCIESLAVGARDRIVLIEADGKRLLIGMGQGGMRTLHVYEGTSAPEEAVAPLSATPPAFAELLARWRGKS